MGVKSDIEIAQEAQMLDIREVAAKVGVAEDDLELYGKYKAKISDDLYSKLEDKKDGKLILVTAINPTPAGEGKTTITIGLTQALNKMGKKSVAALREPCTWSMFWNKRRCSRWWIFTGSAYGRTQSSFYRRFSCNNICK